MAMAGNAGSRFHQLGGFNPSGDAGSLEKCLPACSRCVNSRLALFERRQISSRNEIRKERFDGRSNLDFAISDLYNQHLRKEANNAIHEIIALLRSSGAKESRILMDFLMHSGSSPDFWLSEVIVKQEIELYSGQQAIIKLVELEESTKKFGFLDGLKWLVEWMKRFQHRMAHLRLGVSYFNLWKDFKAAYMTRVKKILTTDLVSRRTCCPASIIYKNFEDHISWRHYSRRSGKGGDGECSDSEKYKVECEVDVISWRERFITASIDIEADINRVWEVLTDYERLAEFIPNLIHSARIPCPYPGRIWLLQRGLHSAMYWHIEATVVLDLEEFPHAGDGRSLQFCMVDGDFKKYAGRWLLQRGERPGTTSLHYEVNVIPRLLLPGVFVEGIIKSDLPVNLRAIAERAEKHQRSIVKYPVATPIKSIVSKVAQAKVTSFVQTDDKKYAEKWDNEGVNKVKRVCKSDMQCTVDEVDN